MKRFIKIVLNRLEVRFKSALGRFLVFATLTAPEFFQCVSYNTKHAILVSGLISIWHILSLFVFRIISRKEISATFFSRALLLDFIYIVFFSVLYTYFFKIVVLNRLIPTSINKNRNISAMQKASNAVARLRHIMRLRFYPEVAVFDSKEPMLFTTGHTPEKSYILISSKIFDLLTEAELESVIGHELAHIKTEDAFVMLCLNAACSSYTLIPNYVLRVLSSLIVTLLPDHEEVVRRVCAILESCVASILCGFGFFYRNQVSREREISADKATAVALGHTKSLSSALLRIQQYIERSHPHLGVPIPSSLCFYPRVELPGILASHPKVSTRLKTLESVKKSIIL